MKDVWMELGQVLVTSVVSLVVMFILTRLDGKRQLAQMSMFDYVNSITVGSIAAELATNLEEWYRPLTAMILYGIALYLVHFVSCKSMAARRILCGQACILMENGAIYRKALAKAGIDLNEFLGQARIAGYFDLNEVQCAILETSGQISFLPKSQNRPATPEDLALQTEPCRLWIDLVMDGKLLDNGLKKTGRDRQWLNTQLHRQAIGQLSEVFYAACDQNGNFFACRGK